jgi:predicted enzyme related to lactoylglutathione lyase
VYDRRAPQRVAWNELASPDLARAKAFYSRHFNFQFNEVMPMGPMGDYCFIDHDGLRIGAIMQQQHAGTPAAWLFYFRVASLASARAAIEAGGGTVLQGPQEVPDKEWILVASDPQGATFAVVSTTGI